MNFQSLVDEIKRLESRVALALAKAAAAGPAVVGRGNIIFRPGVPSAGAAVATWAEVQAAIAAADGFITVAFDSTFGPCVVPGSSGITDCRGATTFTSYNLDAGTGGVAANTLTVQDGATLHRPRALIEMDLSVACVTMPALTFATSAALADTLQMTFASIIVSAGALLPTISISVGGLLFLITESAGLDSSAAGSTPLLEIGSAGELAWDCLVGKTNIAGTACVTGGGGGATILFTHTADTALPAFAAMGFVGTVTESRYTLAAWAQPAAGAIGGRPVAPNVQAGQLYWDETLAALEVWSGNQWSTPPNINVVGFVGIDPTGASDSAATYEAAIVAVTAQGLRLETPGGAYSFYSGVAVPSDAVVRWSPEATLTSQTATTAELFYNTGVIAQTGSLAATPALGGSPQTLEVTGFVPVNNQWIRLIEFRGGVAQPGAATLQIKSFTGSGPYVVTVDRPLVFPFLANDIAYLVSAIPTNVELDFGNALVQGTYGSPSGGEICEFTNADHLTVRNLRYVGTPAGNASVVGFDVGCRNSKLEDGFFDITASGSVGWYFQSNERSVAQRIVVKNAATAGELFDCYSCQVEDHWSYDCGTALAVTQFASSTFGSTKCTVRGGGAVACATGLSIYGSNDTTVLGYSADYSTVDGCVIDGTGGAASATNVSPTSGNTSIRGGGFTNGAHGIRATANAAAVCVDGVNLSGNTTGVLAQGTYMRLRAVTLDGCTNACILASGTYLEIDGAEGTTTGAAPFIQVSAGDARLQNLESSSTTTGAYCLEITTSGTVVVDKAVFTLSGANQPRGVYVHGGAPLVELRRVSVPGGATGYAFFFTTGTIHLKGCTAAQSVGVLVFGATVIIDPDCDFSACTTPVSYSSGTLIVEQRSSVVQVNATAAMTLKQLQCSNIESSGNAAGTITVTASLYVPGMQWTVRNNNSAAAVFTFMGILIAVGKTAIIRINSAGAGERVTADT